MRQVGKIGLTTVALIVGCAGGVAVREVAFPTARAAAGAPAFGYKIVDAADLIETVRQRNPGFAKAEDRAILEEGMAGFGRAGWRYAGCLQPGVYTGAARSRYWICDQLIFEQGSAAATPPTMSMAPPVAPEVISPPSTTKH